MASTVASHEVGLRIGELDSFPFRSELSLAPLIAVSESAASDDSHIGAGLAGIIGDWLRQAAELRQPIQDLGLAARHRELVETLLSKVIPSAYRQQDHAAVFVPFTLRPFYAT